MQNFNYEAETSPGVKEHGVVKAESKREAKKKLRARGFRKVKVEVVKAKQA